MKDFFAKFAAKPHQLFFFGGIINALLFMALLLVQYRGSVYLEIALPVYHAYSMIFAVFTQFFTAFLFTMFPRFLATPPVSSARYVPLFLLLNASSFLFAASIYFAGFVTIVALVGMFVAFVMICGVLLALNSQSSVVNRYDTNWLLLAFGMGMITHLLFLLPHLGLDHFFIRTFAINIGFFLYLFMVVLTLSQKMILFFTEGKVDGYKAKRSRFFLEAVFFLLVIKVVLASMYLSQYGFMVDLLLFGVTLAELMRWRLPLFRVEAILWVLYLSLVWIPVGFLLFFLEGLTQYLSGSDAVVFEKSPLHTIAIGYFTTILLGFGTRIILGHSGQKPRADGFMIALFWLIQLLLVVRIAAGLILNIEASFYTDLMILSAVLWLVLFLSWLIRHLNALFGKALRLG